MRTSALFFWIHFVFATIVHITTPIMIIGLLKLLFVSNLDFFTAGAILGSALFSLQFIVNHLHNPDSFCVLSDLENYYRNKENKIKVRAFLPRFYQMWRNITKRKWEIPE